MQLFEIVSGHAMPSIHALLIDPFKTIWENDMSDGKAEAIKVFTYVELVCSPKKSNPLYGLKEEVRIKRAKKKAFGDEEYNIGSDVMFAIIEYKELLADSTPSYTLVESALIGAHRLDNFLKNYDFKERSHTGVMVLKPADVQKALNQVPDTIKKLEELREKVSSEIDQDTKTRNDREIGPFEE